MKEIKNIIIGLLIVIAAGITACGGGGGGGGGGRSFDRTPSNIPTNVTAEAGNEQATIRWDSVAGAQSYNIYWDTSDTVSKSTGNLIYDELSPFVDTGLTNNTTYYYVITCVTADGESDESKTVSATPSLNPPPPPVP
jgi:fibronectin type 3 domain-containing protein